MDINNIISDIENEFDCKVIYAVSVGSSTINNLTANSDRDYQIYTDTSPTTVKSYNLPGEKIDIWISNMDNMKKSYPFVHICSIDGIDNLAYVIDSETKNYLTDNKQELYCEFSRVVCNITYPLVIELRQLGEEIYNSDFRRYSSRMRDTVLTAIKLTNYKNSRPIAELTAEQKQTLRDIRGKDEVRLSYQESLSILNTIFNQDLIDYYSSLNPGKRKTRELYKIINKALNK